MKIQLVLKSFALLMIVGGFAIIWFGLNLR
jgi:hypothetical protein